VRLSDRLSTSLGFAGHDLAPPQLWGLGLIQPGGRNGAAADRWEIGQPILSAGICFVGRADVYVQSGAADPVLSPDTVLALVHRHVPDAAAVTGVDESGGEARAYLVDDDMVVKTQRPHRLRPRTSLAKEAYLLDTLASAHGYPGCWGTTRSMPLLAWWSTCV
jgi:hypothetical protein